MKLRKLFSIMFIFIVVSAYTPESNVFAEDSSSIDPLSPMEIRLTVGKLQYTKNGVQDLFDVAPFIDSVNARTMVPIRFIAQAMGAKIEWIDAEKTDYITVWGKTLKIVLNQPLPNGMGAAVIKDDRLFVPVRYVSEQLGATVGWDKAERSVVITFMAKLNGVSYSKYNPIVAGSFLLGGFDGKKWIDQDETYRLINNRELYKVYIDGRFISIEAGIKKQEQTEYGYQGVTVELPPQRIAEMGDIFYEHTLMISDNRDVWIRNAEKLSNENTTYAKIVSDYSASRGHAGLKLNMVDLYRIDIDGDGVDEVLINANTGMTTPFGSVLYIRKYINGKLENIVLDENFYTYDENSWDPMITHKVLWFCDLNHDGKLEIITKSNGIDYLSYNVYELRSNKFVCVLSNGAGA